MKIVKRYEHINRYKDRHGKQRYYYKVKGMPQASLPGEPGTPEFDAAYEAAKAQAGDRDRRIGKDRAPIGTVDATIAGYYEHNAFMSLEASTRQSRRAVLEKFRADHGTKPIAALNPEHLHAILGKLQGFAQHNWLKALRGLMQYAVDAGKVKIDPTTGIKRAKVEAGSIHTWTEGEIAQYLATHPKGSPGWKALVATLCTGQRGSDVVRMGPQHVQGNRIYVKQQKTGTEVLIPIHPMLRELIELRRMPDGVAELRPQPFLLKAKGKPYTRVEFSDHFRAWCDEAGLPKECVPHGLRKAMCRRLAEAGCSAMEIMAITGHKTLAEVERYVREAEQVRLADSAMRAVADL